MKIQFLLAVALFLCGLCKIHLAKSTTQEYVATLKARCILHKADWLSVASISTEEGIRSYPFVSLKSVSDGPVSNSTGIPYLYVTNLDVTIKDLQADPKVTVMATSAQTDTCKDGDIYPQDPRSPKVFLTGKFVKVENTSSEYNFAKNSLFDRHPQMRDWPKSNDFYVAKINITKVQLSDDHGGMHQISVKDYFRTDPISCDFITCYPVNAW